MPAPFLLTMADYYGTLAAARCLGAAGVPVAMADWRRFAPASWSRHVRRKLACPPIADPERLVQWLLAFGAAEPGHVLYPSSDDVALLVAAHEPELRQHFRLYTPGLAATLGLLDKRRLHEAAARVGLDTPETWFPETDAEVIKLSRELPMPVLIKPRMQALFTSLVKGGLVRERGELAGRYRAFTEQNGYAALVMKLSPEVTRPMVQRYHAEAVDQIDSVAGFIDESGELFAVRGARKILQRPRRLGIGLCFEAATPEPAIAEKLRALCQEVGYFGAFEAELIRVGTRRLLIDFNPRFYSQMAFEVARGLPLPLLIHRAATGQRGELARLVAIANAPHDGAQVYTHSFALSVLLAAQELSGALPGPEAARWRRWYREHRARAQDAARDQADPLPGLLDIASHLYGYARHPRSFVRSIVLDR